MQRESQQGKKQGNSAGKGSRNGSEQGSHKARGSELFLSGVFQSHVRGFGFVTVQGLSEDLYIPAGKTGNAFYGDTVEVRILSGADPEMMQQIRAIHEAEQNGTGSCSRSAAKAASPPKAQRTGIGPRQRSYASSPMALRKSSVPIRRKP
jgi:exoribonuclease R